MVNNLPTLVIGASPNPQRYSYRATNMLLEHGHEVYAYGVRNGNIGRVEIHTNWPEHIKFHTVTLYINPTIQEEYYNAIIELKPERVIFNPGTENPTFYQLLREEEIQVEQACTLVMLRTGQYSI